MPLVEKPINTKIQNIKQEESDSIEDLRQNLKDLDQKEKDLRKNNKWNQTHRRSIDQEKRAIKIALKNLRGGN